jgi:redox-sensitive bicupin YhaK (pirin superfamily)
MDEFINELPLLKVEGGLNQRRVKKISSAPTGLEGEGFPVYRAFAGNSYADLDPFVHMDQMGAVEYEPGEAKGTPWHPHRGFETVTYMLNGIFVHNDSNGGGGVIKDGDTQWMTAGKGILHIERPPEDLVAKGGLFHGIQLWVNLPRSKKFVPPRYQDIASSYIKKATSTGKDCLIRVIAGKLGELSGPGITHTPINFVHVSVFPEARVLLPWPEEFNMLIYVLSGSGQVSDLRTNLKEHQLAVMGPGSCVELINPDYSKSFEVLLLGGEPIKEPVVAYGPFVMNTKQEIIQAFEDYEKGILGSIPAEAI